MGLRRRRTPRTQEIGSCRFRKRHSLRVRLNSFVITLFQAFPIAIRDEALAFHLSKDILRGSHPLSCTVGRCDEFVHRPYRITVPKLAWRGIREFRHLLLPRSQLTQLPVSTSECPVQPSPISRNVVLIRDVEHRELVESAKFGQPAGIVPRPAPVVLTGELVAVLTPAGGSRMHRVFFPAGRHSFWQTRFLKFPFPNLD